MGRVVGSEVSAHQNIAIGIDGQRIDGVGETDPRIKGRIQRAVMIEPRDIWRGISVVCSKRAADDNSSAR